MNSVRDEVARWRRLPESDWRVTGETKALLRHWRSPEERQFRPFFAQVEAVETLIWLTEVAPRFRARFRRVDGYLLGANESANPGIPRVALKLATGAGKTMVMAMLIAWQAVNSARHPKSPKFARAFLVITPGITIRNRLRQVLRPGHRDSYYRHIVPTGLRAELATARIVVRNYQAFRRGDDLVVSGGGRELLQGQGPPLESRESDGAWVQRLMKPLTDRGEVLVLNDEGHHCYRERSEGGDAEAPISADEKEETNRNRERARLWLSGLQVVKREIGLRRVVDLSATPFFLRGSGYEEGTLFPWTVSDFSLMDAIESGIVKLPRVPVEQSPETAETPIYRNLWKHVGKKLPKRRTKRTGPPQVPPLLEGALDTLYAHYESVFGAWEEGNTGVPPCFLVVCNNTSTSRLLFEHIAGFRREPEGREPLFGQGKLRLFRNFDPDGARFVRPRTILIDSEALESGDALPSDFRAAASHEIEQFRREMAKSRGSTASAELTDEDLLREVANTVGQSRRLGAQVRCVVSVSMLSEGWDARNVTHILGVRAFGTQLLCEQVVGRALRRQSYIPNEDGRFEVEYADIFGVPFDFTAAPTVSRPVPKKPSVEVCALAERAGCEIRFPRIEGYRQRIPDDRLSTSFHDDSTLELTTEIVGPWEVINLPLVGAPAVMTNEHLDDVRELTVVYRLTQHLVETRFLDGEGVPMSHLFGQLRKITGQWVREHLVCRTGTKRAQVLYAEIADIACQRIADAVDFASRDERRVEAVPDRYCPEGSTAEVRYATTQPTHITRADRCQVNRAACDSSWEQSFCKVVDQHPAVRGWVKNSTSLGFEVPWRDGSVNRRYQPDFIVVVDDGRGPDDRLHLVVEIKGLKDEAAKSKASTIRSSWIPGVNALGRWGRWDFVEFRSKETLGRDFDRKVREARKWAAA